MCALRFIAAPLTGGLRPSKGCACGYVHNTVHQRMHVGPWMRRRARWLRERETPCAARVCVHVCTRHLRRGVNGDGTTTRVAGRNCEIVAGDHLDPLGIYTRTRQNWRCQRGRACIWKISPIGKKLRELKYRIYLCLCRVYYVLIRFHCLILSRADFKELQFH